MQMNDEIDRLNAKMEEQAEASYWRGSRIVTAGVVLCVVFQIVAYLAWKAGQ